MTLHCDISNQAIKYRNKAKQHGFKKKASLSLTKMTLFNQLLHCFLQHPCAPNLQFEFSGE